MPPKKKKAKQAPSLEKDAEISAPSMSESYPLGKVVSKAEIDKYRAESLSPVKMLCFRGDSRDYNTIFALGFERRQFISTTMSDLLDNVVELIEKGDQAALAEEKGKLFRYIEEKGELAASGKLLKIISDHRCSPMGDIDFVLQEMHKQASNDRIEVIDDEKAALFLYSPFESAGGNSVSKRMNVSALFPHISHEKKTRFEKTTVYAVYVEEVFDVHAQGILSTVLDYDSAKADPEGKDKHSIEELMFAEEMITGDIPAKHVIGALELTVDTVKGTFVVDRLHMNDGCEVDEAYRSTMVSYLRETFTKNRQAHAQGLVNESNKLPDGGSGWVKGDVRHQRKISK